MQAQSLILTKNLNEGAATPDLFEIQSAPAPTAADCPAGGLVVRLCFVSADPYMRGRMRGDRPGGFVAGQPISAFVSGVVVASNGNDAWVAGDLFGALLPIVTVQCVSAAALASTAFWKLNGHCTEATLSHGIGALGMPGATAWGGFHDVLRPKAGGGETIVVTAASGAVGALVGQLAKLAGCRVIGTAGGPNKARHLVEHLKFDVGIDYRPLATVEAFEAALRAEAPKGVDMVFENVGAVAFEACFRALGQGGRLAVCGGIAHYDEAAPPRLTINPMQMIYTEQRIEGFVSTPWLTGRRGRFLEEMSALVAGGKLVLEEEFFDGLAAWPAAFASLFSGKHMGKVVVRV